jgi:hypothetical protein
MSLNNAFYFVQQAAGWAHIFNTNTLFPAMHGDEYALETGAI